MWKSASASGSPCSKVPVESTLGVEAGLSSRSTVRGVSLRATVRGTALSSTTMLGARVSAGLRSGSVSTLVSRTSARVGSMANGAKPSDALARRRRAARMPRAPTSNTTRPAGTYQNAFNVSRMEDSGSTAGAGAGAGFGLSAGLVSATGAVAVGSVSTAAGAFTSSTETSSPGAGAARRRDGRGRRRLRGVFLHARQASLAHLHAIARGSCRSRRR